MDGNIEIHQEYTELQLKTVNTIIKSGNPDHILCLLSVLHGIQGEVNQIHNYPPEILQRIGDTVTIVEGLIEGKEFIDTDFLEIIGEDYEISILPVAEGLIVYLGEVATLLPCSKKESEIIGYFLQYPDGLPINEGQKEKLLLEVNKLNGLLNYYGVFFGIVGGKLIFSNKEIEEEKQSGGVQMERVQEVVPESKIIFSTFLHFGLNGEVPIKFEIYNPIKNGNSTQIKCNIGGFIKSPTPAILKSFLGFFSSGDNALTYTREAELRNFLEGTKLELIGSNSSGFKLAIKSETTDATKIKYFHNTKDPIPDLKDIQNQTLTTQKNLELFCVDGFKIGFIEKKQKGKGFEGLIIILFPGESEFQEMFIKGNQYSILQKLVQNNGIPLEVSIGQANNDVSALRKIFGKDFIKRVEGGFYIGKFRNPDDIDVNESTPFRDIPREEMSESEIIEYIGTEFSVNSHRRTGVGKNTKYHIRINDVILDFTPAQNTVLKRLLDSAKKIGLTNNEKIHVRNIMKILGKRGLGDFSDFLKSRLAQAKKKKTRRSQGPITSKSRVSNSGKKEVLVVSLDDKEIIDFILGDLHIFMDSKKGNGNLCKYILIISQGENKNSIELTTKERELFFSLSQNIGFPVSIEKNATPTLNNLRRKLPSNFIKNKRGEGYYIGVLSSIDFDEDESVGVMDISVQAMIDAARKSNTPTSSSTTLHRRSPSRKKEGYTEEINGLGAEFIEILESHPGEEFTIEDILRILEMNIENPDEKKLGIITAIETYNSNNPERKIMKTAGGWSIPNSKGNIDLDHEFDIRNFSRK